jgi:hypothetical protein
MADTEKLMRSELVTELETILKTFRLTGCHNPLLGRDLKSDIKVVNMSAPHTPPGKQSPSGDLESGSKNEE